LNLIFSTDEFMLKGQAYAGFPILVDNKMNVVDQVLQFLIYHCITRGRVESKHTWKSHGQTMYDYFGFLELHELSWKHYNFDDGHSVLAAYRDWSLSVFNLNPNTVNLRLNLIIKFYRFAHNKGWVDYLPYDIERIRANPRGGFLAHTDTSGGLRTSADVMLKSKHQPIKLLSKEQSRQFLTTIKNSTHYLVARLALHTGMRLEELVTFPCKYVVNPELSPNEKCFRITLDPKAMEIKGNKPRSIDIFPRMMADLFEYMVNERHRLSGYTESKHSNLFLSVEGKPYSRGGQYFTSAWKGLDLSFSVTPHMLRHTYATHTLYDMGKKNMPYALLYVRDRLGHSSITTTQRYTHVINEYQDSMIDNYQEWIEEINN